MAGVEPVRCSDAEFLRRVSLDLIGMPPTADEARAFLADTGRRQASAADRPPVRSPHYARHLADTCST